MAEEIQIEEEIGVFERILRKEKRYLRDQVRKNKRTRAQLERELQCLRKIQRRLYDAKFREQESLPNRNEP